MTIRNRSENTNVHNAVMFTYVYNPIHCLYMSLTVRYGKRSRPWPEVPRSCESITHG